jgi:hypothetical protein
LGLAKKNQNDRQKQLKKQELSGFGRFFMQSDPALAIRPAPSIQPDTTQARPAPRSVAVARPRVRAVIAMPSPAPGPVWISRVAPARY